MVILAAALLDMWISEEERTSCTVEILWMHNEQNQFFIKERKKTFFLALGDPSVLSSGPLICVSNPTTLHVWYVPFSAQTHLQTEGAKLILFVFQFHIKYIKNQIKQFYIKHWIFFLLRILMRPLSHPSAEVWKSTYHCMLHQTNRWIHSIHRTDWFFSLCRG